MQGMMFTTKVTIIGVLSNQGKTDSGIEYDYTRVIALTPLTGGKNAGMSSVEYNYGTSSNFEKLKDSKFPFEAEVTCQIVTTGKTQKVELQSFVPVPKSVGVAAKG